MADRTMWHYYAHLSCPVAGGYWAGRAETPADARRHAIADAHDGDCDAKAWPGACEGCPAQRTPEQAERARAQKAANEERNRKAIEEARERWASKGGSE